MSESRSYPPDMTEPAEQQPGQELGFGAYRPLAEEDPAAAETGRAAQDASAAEGPAAARDRAAAEDHAAAEDRAAAEDHADAQDGAAAEGSQGEHAAAFEDVRAGDAASAADAPVVLPSPGVTTPDSVPSDRGVAGTTDPVVAAAGSGVAGGATGGAAADGAGSVQALIGEHAQSLIGEWREIQAGFVDEPRAAVRDAQGLLLKVLDRLAEAVSEDLRQREEAWGDGGEGQVSTEDLRISLQRYRSLFQRLTAV